MRTLIQRSLRSAPLEHWQSRTCLKLQYTRLASSTAPSSSATSRRSAKNTSRSSQTYNGTSKANKLSPTLPTTKQSTSHSSNQGSTSSSSLNALSTTHPAPLDLPTRQPNQPFFFKYAFTLGKAYVLFYKSGVKSIYKNYVSAQPIQRLIDDKYRFSLPAAVAARAITRAEFQLLNRNSHDMRRVPLFGLVFLLCGEFTPLVVIALSSVVPWTCRIPKQIASDRAKLEKRRGISFRNLTDLPPTTAGTAGLSRQQLIHISWSLGLSSSIWDYLGGKYPGLPNFLLRRKVDKRVKYLDMDDSLINASGAPLSGMDVEEVRMALVERGVDVLNHSEERLRSHLAAWMKSREKTGVEALLLTRPNVWPVQPPSLGKAKI